MRSSCGCGKMTNINPPILICIKVSVLISSVFVTNLIEGRKVPLYGDGKNVRDWLHVEDHCEAVLAVMEKGVAGETYCIGGNNERSNLELTHTILELMGKGPEMIKPVADRLAELLGRPVKLGPEDVAGDEAQQIGGAGDEDDRRAGREVQGIGEP